MGKYAEKVKAYAKEHGISNTKANKILKPKKLAKSKAAQKRQKSRSPSRIKALKERDGCKCFYCETTEELTVDHIIALSKGGSTELENLRLVCKPCNAAKGNQSHEKFHLHRIKTQNIRKIKVGNKVLKIEVLKKLKRAA